MKFFGLCFGFVLFAACVWAFYQLWVVAIGLAVAVAFGLLYMLLAFAGLFILVKFIKWAWGK
jgi:hypothetical protein